MKLLIKTLSSKELQSKGLSIDRAVFTLPVPDSATLNYGTDLLTCNHISRLIRYTMTLCPRLGCLGGVATPPPPHHPALTFQFRGCKLFLYNVFYLL